MSTGHGLVLALLVLIATACSERGEPPRTTARPVAAPPVPATGPCEHGVPEALCTKCDPALAAVFQSKGDWCEEHGFPESFCPTCNPDARVPEVGTATAAPLAIETRTVRFRSSDIEAAADIRTVTVRREQAPTSTVSTVETTARLAFHGDRIADIHAIVPGIVRKVRVELGDTIESGAALFELESTSVGEIQAELQSAHARVRAAKTNLARQRDLRANDITSVRQVDLAEQELATAQAQATSAQAGLRMVGAKPADPTGRYTLTAPIAGTVVRRPAVLGILATEETSLATISDTSVMWAVCDVPERAAARVAVGQTVHVSVDGDSESSFAGVITWIAAEVDPLTRTVAVHAELPNPTGQLRANQFGRARIETSAAQAAVSVPRSAVQRVGELDVVFVRTEPGVYAPRVVRRHGDGDMVWVEGRVADGDAVVTTGAVLLRTEIMPGSIGAGCCEVEPAQSD